jgi:hypothetical protein
MAKLDAKMMDVIRWEWGQNLHIDEAHAEAGRADLSTRALAMDVKALAERVDRLVLAFLAAVSLLKEKAGVTDEEFLARVRQIDLSDGVADGKARKPLVRCPKCDAVMSNRHNRCLWCGERRDLDALDKVK